VRIGILLAGAVMPVLADGLMRRQAFQPFLISMVEAGFIVIDEHRGGDVHGIDQHKALFYATLSQGLFHLRGDIDEGDAIRQVEPEFLAKRFHPFSPSNNRQPVFQSSDGASRTI
jgi:hypothetical protein